MSDTRTIPLHRLHEEHGARFAPFAGYEMPMRYEAGGMAEHLHTRAAASLFDVSHMGLIHVGGSAAADALERIVPSNMRELGVGRNRYTFLLNEAGGVIDDLMVTNAGDHFGLVVNAGTKEADLAHIRAHIGAAAEVSDIVPAAILALQGPLAVDVLGSLDPSAADLAFSNGAVVTVDGVQAWASRSGYTGEDGFELIIKPNDAEAIARTLLADDRVEFAGLAARDSLRLEAGLCLYGHDLTDEITPIEAGLSWAIQKRRREDGGFLGADVIQDQLANGVPRTRVGFVAERRPVRDGATLHTQDGVEVGFVTSGTFGPSADRPVGMGYLDADVARSAPDLIAHQRGKEVPVSLVSMPFVPHRYAR